MLLLAPDEVALSAPSPGEDAHGWALPGGVSIPVPPPTGDLVQDAFDRANTVPSAGLGVPDKGPGGPYLTQLSGDGSGWAISGGNAFASIGGGGPAWNWLDVHQADVEVEQVMAIQGRCDCGPCARVSPNGDMIWVDISSNGPSGILGNVFTRIAGSNTAIGTLFSRGPQDSYRITLRVVGSAVTVLIDGDVVATGADTRPQPGTGVGLFAFGAPVNVVTAFAAKKPGALARAAEDAAWQGLGSLQLYAGASNPRMTDGGGSGPYSPAAVPQGLLYLPADAPAAEGAVATVRGDTYVLSQVHLVKDPTGSAALDCLVATATLTALPEDGA